MYLRVTEKIKNNNNVHLRERDWVKEKKEKKKEKEKIHTVAMFKIVTGMQD